MSVSNSLHLNLLNLTQSVISVSRLNHYFGQGQLRKQVLFNVDLEITAGEIVIMTGPSGSGKTTLLTLICGLRSPQQGSLQLLGEELYGVNEAQLIQIRRNIGYIFQAHNLLKSLTVLQNVQMSLQLHDHISFDEGRAKAIQMLKAVGLENYTHYYPNNLSGGQKQRVAIARALVSHPKVVLADEPTAALDSKSGREVVDLMHRLAKEQGCTILMVTHDNRILDVADRIVYMEDGHLVSNRGNKLVEP
jgi:putative ABC transport system ATP-binding protein